MLSATFAVVFELFATLCMPLTNRKCQCRKKFDSEVTWAKLLSFQEHNFLMGASSSSSGVLEQKGLESNHWYVFVFCVALIESTQSMSEVSVKFEPAAQRCSCLCP